jgi:hypothetical protein
LAAFADGILTSPAQVTTGFIRNRGDVDGDEVTRAYQAGQVDGVTAIGFHPVARLVGNQRGGDDPTALALFHEIPGEPVATRPRLIDKDQRFGLGVHVAHELITIGLPGADRAEIDDLGVVVCGDIGYGNRVFVAIHADVKHARLLHG